MRVLYKIILLLLALPFAPKAQQDMTFPLKEQISLTGNYAELRPNHFHAGLDFKTHPEKHLLIYAVADGYVSRIKVGTHGYGKVLYITHASGLVSVYGHQYGFNNKIKKYVEVAQEIQETFEIELFPGPNDLPVKQGEVIGFSGNTGDSEGSHLHFEVRNEKTEVPLNPLRFLKVLDTVAPVITSFAVYEDDYTAPAIFKVKKKTDTVMVSAKFGVGVECFDTELAGGSKNNIYKIELRLDDKLFYAHVLDSIAFDLARYVNTYCDYEIKMRDKIKIQKCFVGKNNDLPIYKTISKNGFVYLDDTLYHPLTIRVYDFYDHRAEVKMVVKRRAPGRQKPIVQLPQSCLLPFKKTTERYSIELPAKSLYTDVTLVDSFSNNTLFFYAKGYNVPFQKSCTLSIKPPAHLLKYADKFCLAGVSGKDREYAGGNLENDLVKATVKNFGTYKVSLDTLAPKIKYIKPKKKLYYKDGDMIYFKVSDDLSGIGKFKITVNDTFQLAEYEHKTGMIFFAVKETTTRGKIKVKLVLDDKKNNRAALEVDLLVK